MNLSESVVQESVKVMRSVKPYDPKRETLWQYQARQVKAILKNLSQEKESN